MSDKNPIARPYAKALFEIAKNENQLSAWSEVLNEVALITCDPQMVDLLKHPQFSIQDSLDLIFEILPPSLSSGLKEAIIFIGKSNRLLFMKEIAVLFDELKREHDDILNVIITSVDNLKGTEFADKITKLLKERYQQNNVVLHFEVDPSLIGGAIIKTGDIEIDGSLRGRLMQLRDALGL